MVVFCTVESSLNKSGHHFFVGASRLRCVRRERYGTNPTQPTAQLPTRAHWNSATTCHSFNKNRQLVVHPKDNEPINEECKKKNEIESHQSNTLALRGKGLPPLSSSLTLSLRNNNESSELRTLVDKLPSSSPSKFKTGTGTMSAFLFFAFRTLALDTSHFSTSRF